MEYVHHTSNAGIDVTWVPPTGVLDGEALAVAKGVAGRLPLTSYASVDQLPPFEDYSMENRTYRYFTGQPWRGFGFGLSYSSFEYSGLALPARPVAAGESLVVEVDVTKRE